MNEGPLNQGDMVETTDSLEAVGVFRGWKNLFFIVIVLCLVLTQAAFWTVNLGLIKTPGSSGPELSTPPAGPAETAAAAVPAPADANQADKAAAKGKGGSAGSLAGFNFTHLVRTIVLVNGVLLATAVLYCLTMFAGLTISLAGRLGGINQISRALVLSLIVLVLLMLQRLLGPAVPGVIWTPEELVRWLAARNDSAWYLITFYLRFVVFWLVVLALLILAQIRSARWSTAILHRLEII
jgi:hypothetical protein